MTGNDRDKRTEGAEHFNMRASLTFIAKAFDVVSDFIARLITIVCSNLIYFLVKVTAVLSKHCAHENSSEKRKTMANTKVFDLEVKSVVVEISKLTSRWQWATFV